MAEPRLAEPGLWVELLAKDWAPNCPALFLDRDGTVIEDTGYPRAASEVSLVSDLLPALRAAKAAGLPVVIVSNQSGIARGLLGWHEFAAVNARMLDLLRAAGGSVAAILACAYYRSADPTLDHEQHPMRKPNPGMLNLAAELLSLDLARSLIVGDKNSDLVAGYRAGLRRGFLIGNDKAGPFPTAFEWSRLDRRSEWRALVASVETRRPR